MPQYLKNPPHSNLMNTIFVVNVNRGVGTGETGEARASPEIRGCIKSNSHIGKKKKNTSGILFLGASPEIILFLRP